MMAQLTTLDITIVISWLVFMMAFGLIVSYRSKKKTANDYFLASNSIPWWAVGGSLIAANISAEQFIGMSGSGYALGFAIAAYELMAAITLILVAKFLLPVYINKKIYTMPQFLEERYNKNVRTGLAIFWVLLFVFVNITSVLYLGSLALESITGISLIYCIIMLAIYAATFSITGGLKAVVWTDVVQVIALVLGGLVATYGVLQAVGGGLWEGLMALIDKAPEKFDMIIEKGKTMIPDGKGGTKDAYMDLPGISVLIGGMWIANLYYWGNNQYIIQRALASKSLDEAQKGAAFAAFIKVFLPLIIVIPGIAAYVLGAQLEKSDQAYSWVLNNHVGTGLKGITLAALIAAIGSSVAAMVNSTSTIFTLDIYRHFFMKKASSEEAGQDTLVRVGKISALVALIIGVIVAPSLGTLDQAFQFIQEFTGFISPGVVAIFLLGMFWKKTSARAAFYAVLISIPLSTAFKFLTPGIPFIDRMGLCFLIIVALMMLVSYMDNKNNDDEKAIHFTTDMFKTSNTFNIMALIITLMVAFLYYTFW
ncbi:MAG: sodium/sugar symporter [Saprospiraceae bacterium]|nr:sodium/sugar symporter [Saprospiraceae bacterium]